jgi:hypothetical protein
MITVVTLSEESRNSWVCEDDSIPIGSETGTIMFILIVLDIKDRFENSNLVYKTPSNIDSVSSYKHVS